MRAASPTSPTSPSSSSPVDTGAFHSDARETAKARIAAVDAAARRTPLKTGPGGAPAGVNQIVAVSSGKGGVGKSTTAVNLALSLSALGLRVGLLDADVYGPSIPELMNLSGQPFLNSENKMIPLENYGIQVMSIGFLVDSPIDPYKPIIWRGPMLQKALHQLLHDVAWDDVDVLLVDMPPGTGDVQITITQRAGLAGAVVVSTPHDLALLDARRGLRMFEQVGVPILGVVENMSGYACSRCGHTTAIFGQRNGARQAAEDSDVDFLGAVPLMPVAIGDFHVVNDVDNSVAQHGTRMPLAWESGRSQVARSSGKNDTTEIAGVVKQLCSAIDAAVQKDDWPMVLELSTQLSHNTDLVAAAADANLKQHGGQGPCEVGSEAQLSSGCSGSTEPTNARKYARDVYMGIAEQVADKLRLVAARPRTSL